MPALSGAGPEEGAASGQPCPARHCAALPLPHQATSAHALTTSQNLGRGGQEAMSTGAVAAPPGGAEDASRTAEPCLARAQGRQMVLLFMFDGIGVARYAVEALLQRNGLCHVLAASWFAATHDPIAIPVESAWGRITRTSGTPPHRRGGRRRLGPCSR